jgi:hypothetical protein
MCPIQNVRNAPRTLSSVKTRRLRVTLREVLPEVARVIDVPASCTLPELHDLLQASLGWTDSHLHQFVAGTRRYGVPAEENWDGQLDEAGVRLRDLPDAFTYLYDFGDDWEHDVEVLGPGDDRPGCVYGEGACPPEDCGGPHGYTTLRKALIDPAHPEHDEILRRSGGRRDFDLAATDLLVRQVVGTVPESVRLVLDLAVGGVKLTPGGRLPRAFVRQVQEVRPDWYPLGRPASVEDDLQPLAVLHDVLRDVGLLRLSKGVLAPTRAAADDLHTLRRLRTWFRPGDFDGVLVELSVAVLVSGDPRDTHDLATAVFPLLGPGWVRDGRPMTVVDVRRSLTYLSAEMRGLDLVAGDPRTWRPGASALTLLPRVPALVRAFADTATRTAVSST